MVLIIAILNDGNVLIYGFFFFFFLLTIKIKNKKCRRPKIEKNRLDHLNFDWYLYNKKGKKYVEATVRGFGWLEHHVNWLCLG